MSRNGPRPFRRRKATPTTVLGAALAAVSLFAVACGSNSTNRSVSSTSTAGASNSTAAVVAPATVNVGVLPIADVAPLYVGIQQGFFKKQNLTVKPVVMSGGAAVASAVLGGSLDFGFAAAVNLLLAKEKGLPVQIIANGDSAANNPAQAWSAIMVAGNSSIRSIKDLKGKTIASNAVEGVNELAIDGILQKNGMSASEVNITVLNFPDMPAALLSGHVPVVSEAEPFVTALKAKGARVISPLFSGYIPGMVVGTWFTSGGEIAHKAGIVRRFVTAITQAAAYCTANPSAVRDILPTYTKIPAAAAQHMALANYAPSLNRVSIQQQEQLMLKLGWLKKNVSVSSLIWSGAH